MSQFQKRLEQEKFKERLKKQLLDLSEESNSLGLNIESGIMEAFLGALIDSKDAIEELGEHCRQFALNRLTKIARKN